MVSINLSIKKRSLRKKNNKNKQQQQQLQCLQENDH